MEITIQQQSCFYKSKGKGTTILFLHGNPDSADLWDGVISKLAPQYHCLAPDLPGFARSAISKDFDFSLEAMGKWTDEFVISQHISKPVHLVVHDVGAFYGLPWAIQYPDKIKSITITNTLFFSDYHWHFWGRIWRTPIIGEVAMLGTTKWLFKRETRNGGPLLPDEFINQGYNHLTTTMKKTVLKLYRAMSPSVFKGWDDRYLSLTETKPVLVVWGSGEKKILIFLYHSAMPNDLRTGSRCIDYQLVDIGFLPKCLINWLLSY